MHTKNVVTTLITILNNNKSLCREYLKNSIMFQARSSTYGLYLVDTADENVIISLNIKVKVFEKILENASKDSHLLPLNVGDADMDDVVNSARITKYLSYEEVKVIAPILHRLTKKSFTEYFEYIVPKADVGIVTYNNTDKQRFNKTLENFQAVEVVNSVKGIKYTGRDVIQLLEYIEKFRSRSFIADTGDDLLFYTFVTNTHTYTYIVSNFTPELIIKLCNSVVGNKLQESLDLQHKPTMLKNVNKIASEAREELRELLKPRELKPCYLLVQTCHEFNLKIIDEANKFLTNLLSGG